MADYQFLTKSGKIIEASMAPERFLDLPSGTYFRLKGRLVRKVTNRDLIEMVSQGKTFKAHGSKGWPMRSVALSVHPDQIPEAVEHDRRLGVPTEYHKSGDPIFENKRHKDRYLKAHGYHDRN